MTHQDAIEHLPWLLNGSLDDARRAEVLAALEESAEVREALIETVFAFDVAGRRPEVDTILDAAFADAEDGGNRLEELTRRYPASAEEAVMVRSSQELLAADEERVPLLASLERRAARWRMAAIAAMVLAAIGLVAIATGPATWSPSGGVGDLPVIANVELTDVLSVHEEPSVTRNLRAGTSEESSSSVVFDDRQPYLHLSLITRSDGTWLEEDPAGDFTLVMRRGKTVLFEIPSISVHDLAFSFGVPTERLAPGHYVIDVYRASDENHEAPLDRFEIELTRRQ